MDSKYRRGVYERERTQRIVDSCLHTNNGSQLSRSQSQSVWSSGYVSSSSQPSLKRFQPLNTCEAPVRPTIASVSSGSQSTKLFGTHSVTQSDVARGGQWSQMSAPIPMATKTSQTSAATQSQCKWMADRQVLADKELVNKLETKMTDLSVIMNDMKTVANEWPNVLNKRLTELFGQQMKTLKDELTEARNENQCLKQQVIELKNSEQALSAQLIQCMNDMKQQLSESVKQYEHKIDSIIHSKSDVLSNQLDSYVQRVANDLNIIKNNIKYNDMNVYMAEDIQWFDDISMDREE